MNLGVEEVVGAVEIVGDRRLDLKRGGGEVATKEVTRRQRKGAQTINP